MADSPPITPTPVADPAPVTPSPGKFANKYDTPEALEVGTRELRKLLDLETPEGSFVGKDSTIARDTAQLEKHYLELQKLHGKMGSAKAPVAAAADPAKPAAGLKIEPAPVAAPVKPTADMDYDSYVKTEIGIENPNALGEEWLKDGKLSEANYAKFAAKGVAKSVVDQHMRGLHAIAQLNQSSVATNMAEAQKIAGGESQLKNLLEWAGNPANVPQSEQDRLNSQLKDPANYPIVAEMLSARHRIAVGAGKAQPLITGSTSTNSSGAATSREEYSKLIKSDSAEAAARIAATPIERIKEWSRL